MNRRIITIILALAAVCGGAKAQRKQSGARANGSHIIVLGRKVIDTANLRIKYAWGATDITHDSTYLDCGQLLIGQHMTKYSSWFVEVADSQRVEWARKNPHAQSVPNGTWWMRGKVPGIWSEYQYSNIFIHGDTLNEWSVMPMGQEWPQRYEEKWSGQEWTLEEDTASFLGHPCQKATCRWRGRDYVAWFAPDIPIRRGPWKFGGLPGLIMKIHDVDSLYVFEAVAIEKGNFPIYQYPKEEFMKSTRTHTWKLQIAYNRNYLKTAGIRSFNEDGTIGDLKSSPHEYDPMELE
ncbi:MAG: GLPGLI family protein [Bacteroidaceae bacterium]|nr:GLPGLI family protein [Bacteroidaceae bacterium]